MTGGGGGQESIAIVGIGCRLPGGIESPQELWRALIDETDAVTEIPADRFGVDDLFDERPATKGRIMSRYGGFIDDIEGFDADFFGLSSMEAERLDPQQRLLLETSWSALEDAGIPAESVAGSPMGVYVGLWLNEYESRLFRDLDGIDFHMTIGTGRYAASGRLSYLFDTYGPSITLDTACSSSLVAVHLGVESLRSGETDLVLAGGANVVLEPFITIAYSQSQMMAPDGRCKFGDAGANGYVRSDGSAMIAMKRLSDAIADGDHIYAVVRGSSVTNDGRSSGYLATPGQAGQAEMLRRAYDRAGVDPQTVGYVEAHGTGTSAGDPVEIGAIAEVIGAGRAQDEPCLVGSVKTNLGHTEGAAGVTGLIKAALALEAGEIPASLHLDTPNPSIPWDEHRVAVADRRTPWPGDGPRRAGVSSFGIAGTNSHIVLEAAPTLAPEATPTPETAPASSAPVVLPISTRSSGSLPHHAAAWSDAIGTAPLPSLAAAAAGTRSHLAHRAAIVSDDDATARAALDALADGATHPALVTAATGREARTVFVFPGQGSQWIGMARDLLSSDAAAFGTAFDEIAAAVEAEVDWSARTVLVDDDHAHRLDDIDVIQPLLFIIEVALAAQWQAWGCTPDAVIGHSMGEVAAAHVAGILSAADAAAIICRRSALMRRVSGNGAMAVVDLPAGDAAAEIAAIPSLSVAVANSPRSTVIAGDTVALDDLLERLSARDIFCRRVAVDVASHSPQVDPLLDDLGAALAQVTPQPATVAFRSTVRSALLEGPELDAAYWCDNLRQPVQFGDAVAAETDAGPVVFIEMSPHPILLPAIDQTVADRQRVGTGVASLVRDQPEWNQLALGLANAYCAGASIDWQARHPDAPRDLDLPRQPWRRTRHWLERPDVEAVGGHAILGHRFRSPEDPRTTIWEAPLLPSTLARVTDHTVRGAAVMPATGMLEFLTAAVDQATDTTPDLVDVTFEGLLPLDAATRVHTLARSADGDTPVEVSLYATADEAGPSRHAQASVSDRSSLTTGEGESAETDPLDDAAFIGRTIRRGLGYGAAFRGLTDITRRNGRAVATINAPIGDSTAELGRIQVLDLALQTVFAALPEADRRLLLPVAVGRLAGRLPAPERAHRAAASIIEDQGDSVVARVAIFDQDGAPLVEFTDVRFDRADRAGDQLVFERRWVPADLDAADPSSETWLLSGDLTALAPVRAALRDRGASVHDLDDTTSLTDVIDNTDPVHVVHAPEPIGDESQAALAPLALVQALLDLATPTRVSLVTSGVFDGRTPDDALGWGLARTAATEHPELGVRCIDHDGLDGPDLLAELTATDRAPEIVRTGADRLRPEITPASLPAPAWSSEPIDVATYAVQPTTPGDLSGVRAVHAETRPPGPGEVVITVEASGLNFLDVLKALGVYPGVDTQPDTAIGAECAGVVADVGAGVEHLSPGDQVVAITSGYQTVSLLGSHATLPAAFVAHRPVHLDAVTAAGQPIAYVTAHHALVTVAGLRAGETALIHAASGGVGRAAIEICRRIGAEIIATAGTDAKRAQLRELGIERVFDSRSAAFEHDIARVTNGRGVDVVLGAVTGEAIDAGIRSLAPRGRYIEIGKTDLYDNHRIPLGLLRDNRSYQVVDLAGLTADRPDLVSAEFAAVIASLASEELPALPVTAEPVTAVDEVFRTMAAGRHTGKLVIRHGDSVPSAVSRVRPDGVHIITGGLGALGRRVAGELVRLGATRIALLSRRPAGDADLDPIRALGAEVTVHAVDVADRAGLADAFADIRAHHGPIRGVVHAAGVLADSTISRLDAVQMQAALAPKFVGARNLDALTADDPLELFVLFSSIAGWLGLPGQANYAAGNAYLDALARHRRRLGRPATSIAWGPWADAGLAASDERGGRLAQQGLGSLDPDEATSLLGAIVSAPVDDLAVMEIDVAAWIAATPSNQHLFAVDTVDQIDAAPTSALTEQLAGVPVGPMRASLIENEVAAQLGAVLRTPAAEIDHHRPFETLGLDSLLALELRNRLEASTGVRLSATMAFNHPTVFDLAVHLSGQLDPADRSDGDEQVESAGGLDSNGSGDVADATEIAADPAPADDVAALLAAELEAVDRLLGGDA